MNFKHRLTNVLTVVMPFVLPVLAFNLVDKNKLGEIMAVIAFILSPLFSSTISYLMGIGFKPWHRENK